MLRIRIDNGKVFIYVDSKMVWEGTIEEWSFQISHPIKNVVTPVVA